MTVRSSSVQSSPYVPAPGAHVDEPQQVAGTLMLQIRNQAQRASAKRLHQGYSWEASRTHALHVKAERSLWVSGAQVLRYTVSRVLLGHTIQKARFARRH